MDQIHQALGKRPLAPFFLNRISHTGSTSYPRIPTRRPSAQPPEVIILAQPQESSFWRSQNLRICFCSAAALQENRFNPFRINVLSGATRAKAACSPITLIS
jgi:hypothetical protein